MKETKNRLASKHINEMITKRRMLSISLLTVFIMLFLFFLIGALLITFEYSNSVAFSWSSGISWMWIPAIFSLTISILLLWAMLTKNKANLK